ncbi:uncharacterized protein MYCFIDRAFT_180402 [Pseudocercospora fijiensis CIRAD86]|uniref:Uncharacterized protein n=1 Tax=Pseudocercospora fijiensis (strain CIRAD86) TaxID=383855 RepID=M3AIP1_PSEFD|nr:uncharacterized protein MYCFIDRAFT_180402 [Pseudocercospora fijiensis CIRAD86]EME77068.1 hypothetical protein MYCFIDRAFT_180402 [Pseudocercospora fijiensis CIRAD86]
MPQGFPRPGSALMAGMPVDFFPNLQAFRLYFASSIAPAAEFDSPKVCHHRIAELHAASWRLDRLRGRSFCIPIEASQSHCTKCNYFSSIKSSKKGTSEKHLRTLRGTHEALGEYQSGPSTGCPSYHSCEEKITEFLIITARSLWLVEMRWLDRGRLHLVMVTNDLSKWKWWSYVHTWSDFEHSACLCMMIRERYRGRPAHSNILHTMRCRTSFPDDLIIYGTRSNSLVETANLLDGPSSMLIPVYPSVSDHARVIAIYVHRSHLSPILSRNVTHLQLGLRGRVGFGMPSQSQLGLLSIVMHHLEAENNDISSMSHRVTAKARSYRQELIDGWRIVRAILPTRLPAVRRTLTTE